MTPYETWALAISAFGTLGVLGTLIGILITLVKDRRDRLVALHEGSRNAWLEYLAICRENPGIDIFDVPLDNPKELSESQKRVELIAIAQLFSMIERAYMLSHNRTASAHVDSPEWKAWVKRLGRRSNFKHTWELLRDDFDQEFVNWMNELFAGKCSSSVESANNANAADAKERRS